MSNEAVLKDLFDRLQSKVACAAVDLVDGIHEVVATQPRDTFTKDDVLFVLQQLRQGILALGDKR